jgi:hypothetical protein
VVFEFDVDSLPLFRVDNTEHSPPQNLSTTTTKMTTVTCIPWRPIDIPDPGTTTDRCMEFEHGATAAADVDVDATKLVADAATTTMRRRFPSSKSLLDQRCCVGSAVVCAAVALVLVVAAAAVAAAASPRCWGKGRQHAVGFRS